MDPSGPGSGRALRAASHRRDPEFALGHSILAAVELNGELAQPHFVLGTVHWIFEWDWKAAEEELARALELDPEDALAHLTHGSFLATMGDSEASVLEVERAYELDPLSPVVSAQRGWLYYLARRYDDAEKANVEALELNPRAMSVSFNQFLTYLRRGEPERELATELGMEARKRKDPLYGIVMGVLGERDEAFAALDEAYEGRSVDLLWLKGDPDYDPLRSDPRFSELLRRMGLPE